MYPTLIKSQWAWITHLPTLTPDPRRSSSTSSDTCPDSRPSPAAAQSARCSCRSAWTHSPSPPTVPDDGGRCRCRRPTCPPPSTPFASCGWCARCWPPETWWSTPASRRDWAIAATAALWQFVVGGDGGRSARGQPIRWWSSFVGVLGGGVVVLFVLRCCRCWPFGLLSIRLYSYCSYRNISLHSFMNFHRNYNCSIVRCPRERGSAHIWLRVRFGFVRPWTRGKSNWRCAPWPMTQGRIRAETRAGVCVSVSYEHTRVRIMYARPRILVPIAWCKGTCFCWQLFCDLLLPGCTFVHIISGRLYIDIETVCFSESHNMCNFVIDTLLLNCTDSYGLSGGWTEANGIQLY